MSHPRCYVKIEFTPTDACLDGVVRLVLDVCRSVVDDSQVRFAFQLAAHELTENLVKYAIGDKAFIQISVENTSRGLDLVLSTENQATPERLRDAIARLEAAEGAEDPLRHFDNLVQESTRNPTVSRLGLGRLRAEGELEVSHHVDDDVLRIQVRRPLRVSVDEQTQ